MSPPVCLPPRKDPWYTAPAGFEYAKPGTILRMRVSPAVDASTFKNCEAIYNILFATTGSDHRPSWAVTTLFIPKAVTPKTTTGESLLSYQIAYNSVNLNAAPSHLLSQLSLETWHAVIPETEAALTRGWYVNFPDHEGSDAAFADGITEGHTVLDSVRAALHAGFGMDATSTRTAFWGFSGGAVATGWAAELQPHYAAELLCAGAALGALPPSFLALVEKAAGTPFAGVIPQVLLGVTAKAPLARAQLLAQLRAERRDAFLASFEYLRSEAFAKFAGQDVWAEFFVGGREGVLRDPLIREVLLRKSVMGYQGLPAMPLYLYKSVGDEITPVTETDALVERWGAMGVNILYERNAAGDHLKEMENSRPRAVAWLEAVLSGNYTNEGTTVRDI